MRLTSPSKTAALALAALVFSNDAPKEPAIALPQIPKKVIKKEDSQPLRQNGLVYLHGRSWPDRQGLLDRINTAAWADVKVRLDPDKREDLAQFFSQRDLGRLDKILELTSISLAAIGFRSIDVHLRISEEKNWKGAIGVFTTPLPTSFRLSFHSNLAMPSHTVSLTRENISMMLHPDKIDPANYEALDEYHSQLLAGYIYIMINPEVAGRVNADLKDAEQDPLDQIKKQIEEEVNRRENQSGNSQSQQDPQARQEAEQRQQELEAKKEMELIQAQGDLAFSTLYGLKGTEATLTYFQKGFLPESKISGFVIQDLPIGYYEHLCNSYLLELNKK